MIFDEYYWIYKREIFCKDNHQSTSEQRKSSNGLHARQIYMQSYSNLHSLSWLLSSVCSLQGCSEKCKTSKLFVPWESVLHIRKEGPPTLQWFSLPEGKILLQVRRTQCNPQVSTTESGLQLILIDFFHIPYRISYSELSLFLLSWILCEVNLNYPSQWCLRPNLSHFSIQYSVK